MLDLPPDAGDQPYCWVTTRGRRSGQSRTVELWFALRGESVYVLAGGGETADWVRNARAEPAVRVRLAAGEYRAAARIVDDRAEEHEVRRLLAAKYQGWRTGRPLSRWAATALPIAFDLTGVAAGAHRELQVARPARDRLALEAALFALTGDLELPDPRTARRVALGLSERSPEPVDAGDLYAAGLLHEIAHLLTEVVRAAQPDAFTRAVASVRGQVGTATTDSALRAFVDRFPPSPVYAGALDPAAWLAGATEGQPNAEVAIEELVLHAVAAENPAMRPFAELLDPGPLDADPDVQAVRTAIADALAGPAAGDVPAESLTEMLRAPIRASPGSLAGQLGYIRERWGHLVGERLDRVLLALDLLREDETARRMRWTRGGGGDGGAGAGHAPELRGLESESEHFTADRAWMPSVVLLAKNALVWLDQLSRRYGREIRRLDEIPDEELAQIGARGFTGLWLIGVWQRSEASARIKQMRGNPEAAASAYALDDYRIADELGGDEALDRLRERAGRHGVRLASDMVPNHMAVDSRWVVERPELFISAGESPFPSYQFTGPDLSTDGRVGIQIEDGYWDGSDAAVVFRHEDRQSGDVRYVYHGNDGTSTPWNDTAQLDFLRPETREAVADTIIAVCKRFPIVRFDAAMVLAKRHFRRLWYPEPGSGGAIPSRSEHALRARDFDAAMPTEFWRDVVDRAATEAPDTLLLAEAFWLLEGYFVRTLGMHRVYNSAFMNMLRDERNAEYRKVLRETLEFDPEILKRYVSFMSNPDERTAVDQFGTGDKYFAVATLLATLPGLPMFGHGQVEGFTEKYGMEYRRAYVDEQPDEGLVERHEREIFPLLRRRWLFAEARDFVLYDAVTDDGAIDEDVFAFSNRVGTERALVAVHNRFASARVRLTGVANALGLETGDGRFLSFRDHASGLEYLHPVDTLSRDGMRVELDAYGRHVFLDWRELVDSAERPWARLSADLGGRAVPSVDAELESMLARDGAARELAATDDIATDPGTLIARERAAWPRWEGFVRKHRPDARRNDGWRLRDVVAHVAAWHRAAAHGFAAMAAGETEWEWPEDTDAFNAQVERFWRDRSWAEVEAEAEEAHDEFIKAIALLDAEILGANDRLAAVAVSANGFEHYEEHLADQYEPAATKGSDSTTPRAAPRE